MSSATESSDLITRSTASNNGPAVGIWLLRKTRWSVLESTTFYKVKILIFTYIAYASYHASRRPLTVIKSTLHHETCHGLDAAGKIITAENATTWCDWHPFQGKDGSALLGITDSAYLFSYAFFMFLSGWLAERINLRYFLAVGMILSGFFTFVFGLAFYYQIHSLAFFLTIQVILGAFQSTGWPGCLTCVYNWFGKGSKRGLILGIWNSHTNAGNILGAFIAGRFVQQNWGLSFIVPGILIAAVGFLLFLFLVPYPEEVDKPPANPKHERRSTRTSMLQPDVYEADEKTPLVASNCSGRAISICDALRVPGVIEYSISLFFSKLVSYTFLYWLPIYIKNSTNLSEELSAYATFPFDFGGVVGAILAGIIADVTGASGLVCVTMLALLLPFLIAYLTIGSSSIVLGIIIQGFVGLFINGPYCLITTSVAADLGNKVTSDDAMATITAIIDGTGSIGASVGPLIAGLIANYGWDKVFYMVMVADVFSMLLLTRICVADFKRIRQRSQQADLA